MIIRKKFTINDLIEKIEERKVIPIIGSDVIKIQDNGIPTTLLDSLLNRLIQKYTERDIVFDFGENNLTASEKLNHIHALAIEVPFSFYTEVASILKEIEPLADTSTLDKLARIKKFKFYINASFSSLLNTSIIKHRSLTSGYYQSISLDIQEKRLNDIDLPLSANIHQHLRKPIIYNLFNQFTTTRSKTNVIVADDDILELLHTLTQNKDMLPSLFELMSKSSLLFIGCNYPDWLLRFFIRVFSQEKVSHRSSRIRTVADILQDKNRALFISNSDLKYFELDGSAFVDRLFNEISNDDERQSWIRKTIGNSFSFISYAAEDREAASNIYEELDDLDCDTYMDINRLDYGSEITFEIKQAIDNCKIFMPVVSITTDNSVNQDRYHKHEWKYAIELYVSGKKDFQIIPIFLSQITKNEFKSTPEIFYSLKYEILPPDRKFSESLRKRIREIIK